MRIAVTSVGTEGDVRPYIALAAGLRQSGHDAYLVAAHRYRARAATAKVPFCDSGQPWNEEDYRTVMRKVLAERNFLKQGSLLMAAAQKELMTAVPGVIEATRDADLIVHHAADVTGFAASLVHAKPRVTGTLMTDFLPGTLAATFMRLGSGFMDAIFNPILVKAGLGPRRRIALELNESPLLNLVAISRHVAAERPSWKGRWIVTGYWFLDETDSAPDAALETFARERSPILVTFGSMPAVSPEETNHIIAEAARRTGAALILQSGFAHLGQACNLSDNVRSVRYVPHGRLLPWVRGVVHHGGAGTCAAALRAGAPQVIVWHLGDQKKWGETMFRLGVATRPVFHRQMTADALARAIDEIVSQEKYRERCHALRDRVALEDGVARAVEAIDRLRLP